MSAATQISMCLLTILSFELDETETMASGYGSAYAPRYGTKKSAFRDAAVFVKASKIFESLDFQLNLIDIYYIFL